MGNLKQLASQTFIYGLSSIVGRILNYLLVPLYTYYFTTAEYGVVVELYAYVSFLLILLTYGMETGFFNFSKISNDPAKVFCTASSALFTTSALFIFLGLFFSENIAHWIDYDDHVDFIKYFVLILGLDAFTSIPFAYLRQQNQAIKFAVFKLIGIITQIFLNLFFIIWLPNLAQNYEIFSTIYSPNFGVGYIFISNLISSVITFILFLPIYLKTKFSFDWDLLKKMLLYSLPLVVSGLAGMINEFFDRLAIKFFYTVPDEIANPDLFIRSELGIYGANTKIAVLMTLFIQCFRYAADPFFFSQRDRKDFNITFANINKYLWIFGLFIFIGIMGYLNIVKYFISDNYWDGLIVVPFLLIGHLLVGMVYLQSFWYKLNNKTVYGIYIFLAGCVVTILCNMILVPLFGYIACAWSYVLCYLVMLIITFVWGRKYLSCQYDFKRMIVYTVVAMLVYLVFVYTNELQLTASLSINTLLIIGFALLVLKMENLFQPLKNLFNKLLKR